LHYFENNSKYKQYDYCTKAAQHHWRESLLYGERFQATRFSKTPALSFYQHVNKQT